MVANESMFPGDKLSDEIYDLSMNVVVLSKGYFCMLFGHHDSLVDAVSVFIDEQESATQHIADLLTNDTPQLELPAELNLVLRELLTRPCFGKPASQTMMYCRYALLMCCALSTACFRKLEEGDKKAAILAYGKSEFYLAMCTATGRAEFGSGSVSENAFLGAQAKLAADPKQKDKGLVRECWDEWQVQPNRYKGKAAFARDMLSKFENLQSQPVIEGWCRLWERENRNPASTVLTLPPS